MSESFSWIMQKILLSLFHLYNCLLDLFVFLPQHNFILLILLVFYFCFFLIFRLTLKWFTISFNTYHFPMLFIFFFLFMFSFFNHFLVLFLCKISLLLNVQLFNCFIIWYKIKAVLKSIILYCLHLCIWLARSFGTDKHTSYLL